MTTTSSSAITLFNVAQTFFIDPGTVKNAPEISLTKIGLFFESKPKRTGNKSGITAPGVTLFLCEVKADGYDEVPATDKAVFGATSRVEYDSILTSTTATAETTFAFPFPVNVDTGKSYAIVIRFDGDEEFVLWKSVEGKKLVGTNNQTAGPAGKYIGKYFEFSYLAGLNNPISNTALSSQSTNVSGTWKPLNTTDLKFSVYCAKYIADSYANTVSTDPVTGQQTTEVVARRSYILYKEPYEFFTFDRLNSNNVSAIFGGEMMYQNNVTRSETISVLSGSKLITSQTANFTDIFGNSSDAKWLVVYSGTSKNLRKIESIASNGSITVDIPLTFTNAAATFSKVVAGRVDVQSKIRAFGKIENAIALSESSANSSHRFVNNTIESITVVAGGTGYSNSDYIVVDGGGLSGAPEVNAIANVSTNSTGGILTTRITNKGIGFMNTPTYSVKAANGSASAGSGANLSFAVGATLMTEHSNAALANVQLINVPINSVIVGAVDVENPYGTSYYFKNHYLYYSTSDGIVDVTIANGGSGYSNADTVSFTGGGGSGAAGRITTDSTGKIVDVQITASGNGYTSSANVVVTTSGGSGANLSSLVGVFRNSINAGNSDRLAALFERHNLAAANTPLILSRSYEVTQPNGSFVTATGVTVNTNVSSAIEMVITSNNVYTTADVLSGELDVFYERYSINNDYTDENTGNGKAISKHVSPIINFKENRTAEDIRVFMDVYRPANTDIKVFARIHNSKDPEPFVDKDWTLLEIKNGQAGVSSPVNQRDVFEFEYGFPQYPNTSVTLAGTVTTTLSSATVTGSNTTFSTDLAVNDLVKVYTPLFPNNYVVAVVNSVTNATSLTLKTAISNSSVVGAGLKVDKIEYSKQAFNNITNDNVVRYYANNMAEFDGYNSFAIKIVFLSDNEFVVPKVENTKVVGVTA